MDPADRFGLAGTTVAGRYRVERQVAEGGFAESIEVRPGQTFKHRYTLPGGGAE